MMNDFSQIPSESEFRNEMTVQSEEQDISCGWPGDGSGEDDLADYNQNEADDYRNEGEDDPDGGLDENDEMVDDDDPNEMDTPLGDEYGGE